MESSKEFWNVDKNAGNLLQALIFTHHPKHILEIGTSNGYSAILMAKIAQQYGGHITTIEYFEKRIALAKKNARQEGVSDAITVVQGDALEVLSRFSPSYEGELEGVLESKATPTPASAGTPPYPGGRNMRFDFFFIDANKKQYAQYLEHCLRLANPGAIIVADNTISHRNKLADFFAALENNKNIQFLELEIGAGLVIAQAK